MIAQHIREVEKASPEDLRQSMATFSAPTASPLPRAELQRLCLCSASDYTVYDWDCRLRRRTAAGSRGVGNRSSDVAPFPRERGGASASCQTQSIEDCVRSWHMDNSKILRKSESRRHLA